jgi:hypothetical protein
MKLGWRYALNHVQPSLTADLWGYVTQTTELRQRRDDGDRDRATAHPHQGVH